MQPTKGEILVDGKIKNNLKGWQKMIGYVPQDVYIMDDKKKILLLLYQRNKSRRTGYIVYKEVQIRGFCFKSRRWDEHQYWRIWRQISGGQRQRIAIARALIEILKF